MPPAKIVLTALTAASLLLAACGDDDDGADGGDSDSITVEGDVGDDPTIEIPEGFEVTELVTEALGEGDGEEVPAGAGVSVYYEGALLDGTVFDGNFGDPEPITFSLAGVIPGWTEGIPGMRVGGRRLLVIPSEMAYGSAGSGGLIPPDAPLVFVVDLVGIG